MSEFDSHYDSLHDKRTTIKAKLDIIDQAITSLMSISTNDEITSLASATSTSIVDAQLFVNQYVQSVSRLKQSIEEMEEDKKTDERQHFEEQMDHFDGGNDVPVSITGLQELVRDKKMHYQLSLTENLDRVKLLTAVPSSPAPVIPPPVSTQSSTPSNGEENTHSIDDSTTIGRLSTSITQRISHISSSNSRPNLALPPVKLETFDGSDLTRWPAFRYQLDQLVLNQTSLSEVEKAFHVRNSLRGNAFNLVASIPVHEKFLDKIIHRLETQYGRDSLSQAKLIQSLRGIRSKTTSVIDQLSAVQSMISLAHSIHSDSGVDSHCVQLMLAECIHPRFITLISRSKSETLLSSLELIENQLLSEYEDALTISAYTYTAREEQTSHYNNHSFNTSSSPPNNRAQRANNQSFKPPHKGHPPSNQRQSNNKKPLCVYCGRHLFSGDCTQVSSIKDRKDVLRRKSLCHCCFSSSHPTNDCTRSCLNCNGKHHKSLCDNQSVPRSGVNTVTTDHSIQVNHRLFTAPVVLINPSSSMCSRANVLLDTGAQTSLISRALVNSLQLSPVGKLSVNVTGLQGSHDPSVSPSDHDVVEFQLTTSRGYETIKALVRDTDDIVGYIHHPQLSPADLAVIESTLTSIPTHFSDSSVNPDLLLGVGDTLRLLDNSTSTTLPCGYRLVQSVIGPLVAGSKQISAYSCEGHQGRADHSDQFNSQSSPSSLRVAPVVTTTEDTLERKIEHLFSVDPVARIYETTERESRKVADEIVTKHFDDTVQLRDDGYYVMYALKPEARSLPDNHDLAASRLSSTVRSLSKDHNLLAYYDSVIREQLSLGQVETVDPADTSGIIHYLAHQPVLRPDKPSTPLRIVFDASAHLKGKPSLNDVIHAGPSDLENIPSLIMRARSRRFLIIADVEKAFLQVKLCHSQRNMLRFLWLKDINQPVTRQNLLYLRFCVTPFGVNQSPCILSKVINHHIQLNASNCDPQLVHQLASNLYVDNVVINSDSPSVEMFIQSKKLFQSMAMNLRDYSSNDHSFMESIPDSDKSTDVNQKLLGLMWNTSTDKLSIKIPVSTKNDKESKRSMCSTVASTYDPLGLLSPLLLPPRLTVQGLWNLPLKWDDSVDEITRLSFHRQITETEKFTLSVDRFTHLSSSNQITLVAFSDASKQAMAACVYSWVSNKLPTLLISKTRLAPIKSNSTIPKMELESFTMAHSLLLFVVETLRKEFPDKQINVYSFTDSAVVLHWIKPEFNKTLGVFVSNRIKSIQSMVQALTASHPLEYNTPRHVRSEDNPADHATRGLTSSEMNNPNHQWWIGPQWLQLDTSQWPNPKLSDLQCPLVDSFSLSVGIVATEHQPPDEVINLNKYSSLKKAISVTAAVYRFLSKCAAKTKNPIIVGKLKHVPTGESNSFNSIEKRFAMNRLIFLHQSQHVTMSDPLRRHSIVEDHSTGILKIRTRLSNSDMSSDFKLPIYIPSSVSSSLARLIIKDIHNSSCHASIDIILNSLKSRYYIPRARSLAKSCLKQCIQCRKSNNLPFSYPLSPSLPTDRVTQSLPFKHCGIDYGGPFLMSNGEKQWIIIFTCFSTRLSHIEIVSSLLPSAFILALRRFCSRRGTPSRVTSDKATTLKLASTLLSETSLNLDSELNTYLSSHGIQWSFTTAHSPWKGGIYERLIKIIKESLSRSIGKRKLAIEEFNTVMCEIEALLNSRPLTYVSSDDIQTFSGPVIRPIDLILPHSFLGCHINLDTSCEEYVPPEEENSSRQSAIKQLSRALNVVDSFWKRWHLEYLCSLRDATSKSDPLQSTRSTSIAPQSGSIVLVIDESGNTPRSNWKMAQILSLDGTSATLRSHAGRIIERPINLLIPLEIYAVDPPPLPTNSVPIQTTHPMATRSRSRRVYEHQIDLEASLLRDPSQLHFDKMTNLIVDEFNSLGNQCMNLDNEIQTNRESIHSLLESVSSIHSMVSNLTTMLSTQSHIVRSPSVSRVNITPRSSSNSQSYYRNHSVSRTHSTNRDRSRSPHRPSTQSSSNPHKVRCTFCDSVVHLSRNCHIIKSLTKRLKLMPDDHCLKCFRKLGTSHSLKCEPTICRRGCVDDTQKPLRHEDYFCPRNPELDP